MLDKILSKETINRYLRQDLKTSKKKITSIPTESICEPNIDRQNKFLAEIIGNSTATGSTPSSTSVTSQSSRISTGKTVFSVFC